MLASCMFPKASTYMETNIVTGIPSSKRQAKSTVRFNLDSLFRRVLLSSSGSGVLVRVAMAVLAVVGIVLLVSGNCSNGDT